MHVQPEATTVKIANRPLWAPGAPAAVKEFIAARNGNVRVLEFGSGGSTMFLLRLGATVTTVEHHAGWADALQRKAESRGIAKNLTLLRRDRPYYDVPAEFPEGTKFDILLDDGRERLECLRKALDYVEADGLVLLDDSQRERYWPAFALLADKPCVTYESEARNTTLWSLAEDGVDRDFIRKSFVSTEASSEPKPKDIFLPLAFLDGSEIELHYAKREPIADLKPVEADLQRIGLMERRATFIAPSVYDLENASVRIESGKKLLGYGSAVFKEKSGKFVLSKQIPAFEGDIDLKGRTLDLTSSGAGRYSFFLLDVLPKLEILHAAGLSLKDFDTVVVNSGAQWVHDILSWVFENDKPKVHFFNKFYPSFRMERSVHIEGIRSARFTPAWVYSYLDRIFKSRAQDSNETENTSFGQFVYISRQKADGRRIVNEDAFDELIGSFGFREIFAEDYTPLQLVKNLENAQVVISPHGAGLANIMFCPKSAEIIELFSSHFTPQYFHLARDMGQDYFAFACVDAHGQNVFDRYDAETANKAEFNREDIVVPIEKLKQMLSDLC